MRTIRSILSTALVIGMASAAVAATQDQRNAGFDKLKTLVGEWSGKSEDGGAIPISYKLISGGTALMETVGVGTMDMVTIYHPDGDSLMLTHYCESNNQPRMRANRVAADAKTIDFRFLDVTNEAMSTEGIMKNVKFTFQDADHFTEEWTSSKDGKDTPWVFTLTRKK